MQTWSLREDYVVISKQDTCCDVPAIRYSICIVPDMTWKAFVYGIDLATSHYIDSEPMLLDTTIALRNLIGSLDCGYICESKRDDKFEQLMGH